MITTDNNDNISIIDIEPDSCPLQQQQAMQLVLSIFALFLNQINEHLTQLRASLDGGIVLIEQVCCLM